MRRDVFQAIADPTRRSIISLIAMGDLTPNAVAEHFHISRQAVSKHLKILAECELIKPVRAGREIYYHLQPKKMKVIADFLEPYRQLWETRHNQLDKILTQQKTKK